MNRLTRTSALLGFVSFFTRSSNLLKKLYSLSFRGAMRRACLPQAGNLQFLSAFATCGNLTPVSMTIESLFQQAAGKAMLSSEGPKL